MGLSPEVSVTDLSGSVIVSGETNTLPHNKILLLKSTFDGELIIFNDSRIVEKRKIFADKPLELDGLSYGISVQVIIGLDVVWEMDFKKQQTVITNDEAEILKRISNTAGALIPVPHSLRNILSGIGQYPQICQWIRKCINSINEQSYRRLQDIYLGIKTNKRGDKLRTTSGFLPKKKNQPCAKFLQVKSSRNSLRETNRNLQKFKKASELNR